MPEGRERSPEGNRSCYDCRKKCCWFFKKLVVFCFSQIGIICLVVGYAFLGAALFQTLEEPKEELNRVIVGDLRQDAIRKLWRLNEDLFLFEKKNWSRAVEDVLLNFQKEIFVSVTEKGWDGRAEDYTGISDWSFTGAFLYSVTVITTIGYGNITPKTPVGRLVTILYAFFGIPLTMICLANLGHVLSISFKVLYIRLKCYRKKRETGNTSSDASSKYLVTNQQVVRTELEDGEEAVIITEEARLKDTHVPVYVCLLLVVVYILLGTALFSVWESWDPLTAGYFCFITLSTIGFGDVVPGHSLESWASQAKRITCALYLLFGLTLISMCFSLLVDEVQDKARKLGRWVGLLKREEN